MTDTTTTTPEAPEVTLLTGKAREAAANLAKLGDAVQSSLTTDGLAHVASTLQRIMQLQPALSRQLAAAKREHGDDIGPAKFHGIISAMVLGVGDDNVRWTLDAGTTMLCASFKRDAKAWSAYTNLITKSGKSAEPTLKRYVRFQERFLLGHYDSDGKLTPAGEAYDEERRAEEEARLTGRIPFLDKLDWSGFFDGDETKEEEVTIWLQIGYFANAKAIKMSKKMTRESYKAAEAAARDSIR
jgi:hypothetical protein